MITDKTLDEALVELLRTKRALEALRAARKAALERGHVGCTNVQGVWAYFAQRREHAAAKRATLDLTRKLAQLRAGV